MPPHLARGSLRLPSGSSPETRRFSPHARRRKIRRLLSRMSSGAQPPGIDVLLDREQLPPPHDKSASSPPANRNRTSRRSPDHMPSGTNPGGYRLIEAEFFIQPGPIPESPFGFREVPATRKRTRSCQQGQIESEVSRRSPMRLHQDSFEMPQLPEPARMALSPTGRSVSCTPTPEGNSKWEQTFLILLTLRADPA
jgi:hypothetical protein